MNADLLTNSGAMFSPCRLYRYRLWRIWDERKPRVLFLMLNPSTADEFKNDPTIERCQRRAQAWGFGALEVANIFAYRATDPQALYNRQDAAFDPIGPSNNSAILNAALGCEMIVCAWGTHGALDRRGRDVLRLLTLKQQDDKLRHLGLTKCNNPKHPLYIGYSVQPQEFTEDFMFDIYIDSVQPE